MLDDGARGAAHAEEAEVAVPEEARAVRDGAFYENSNQQPLETLRAIRRNLDQ